jgi:spore maturation protein A
MINYVWFALIAIGIITGFATGNVQAITDAALSNAQSAVELSLGMIGVMALWLGIMRIAEDAGLVRKLSIALRPIMTRLFPDVPGDHPAMGAILMNISANVFGLGDAATPFGLKAMKELQSLNEDEETATDAMCTFLAINTSSVTLIPASVIAFRAAADSANPAEIIGAAIIATTASTVVAIIAVKALAKLPMFKVSKPKMKIDKKVQA